MNSRYRAILDHLRTEYDISARIIPGRKHPSLTFVHRGQPYRIRLSNSPRNADHALYAAIHEVRKRIMSQFPGT